MSYSTKNETKEMTKQWKKNKANGGLNWNNMQDKNKKEKEKLNKESAGCAYKGN